MPISIEIRVTPVVLTSRVGIIVNVECPPSYRESTIRLATEAAAAIIAATKERDSKCA